MRIHAAHVQPSPIISKGIHKEHALTVCVGIPTCAFHLICKPYAVHIADGKLCISGDYELLGNLHIRIISQNAGLSSHNTVNLIIQISGVTVRHSSAMTPTIPIKETGWLTPGFGMDREDSPVE